MESRARPLDIPRSPKRLCNNCSHCDAASTLAHGSPSTATLADSTPADDLSTHSPASTAAFPDDHFSDSDHSDLGGESESGVAGPDSPAPSSTRRHAPECVAGMPGPVTVCLCEQKLSEEAKRVVPFLFFYNYSNQEKMLIPHGICCFRKPEPCPVHESAVVPRYATPPPSDGSSLTIKDLPLELFHIHIFPYLYDCELIRVAQLSRNFYVLSLPEFWKRCEALRLLDPNVFDPPCAEEVIVKRNLARYHKRMESLRALQGKEKGPYWKITVDTVDGFPKVTAALDYVSLCSVM